MNKLIVEYDPDNGIALPDNPSKQYVEDAIDERAITLHIINRGKYKYGTCNIWPEGFSDVFDKTTETPLLYRNKV